jgi:hypothetical protein
MRDDEGDEDERLFVEMRRGTGKAPPRRGTKARHKDAFVKVPLWWLEQATRATRTQQAFICVWLLHLAWKAKSPTFPVPNGQLGKHGFGRHTKHRALTNLEAAGLIKVERRADKNPVVTLLIW